MEKIKIGILGYGNLGRGVELSVSQNPDMELVREFYSQRSFSAYIKYKGCCCVSH